jgi:hypothetical protein
VSCITSRSCSETTPNTQALASARYLDQQFRPEGPPRGSRAAKISKLPGPRLRTSGLHRRTRPPSTITRQRQGDQSCPRAASLNRIIRANQEGAVSDHRQEKS